MSTTSASGQAYPDNYPGGPHPPHAGACEVETLGYQRDDVEGQKNSVYCLSYTFAHSADSISLNFSAAGLQAISDESWGLDDMVVTLQGTSGTSPGEVGQLIVADYDKTTEDIAIQYDNTTCGAVDNAIYYAPLDAVGCWPPDTSAVCNIGNTGSYLSFNPGPGSFFFLVVAHDGAGTEGSYGTSYKFGATEQRPPYGTLACGNVQNLSGCD